MALALPIQTQGQLFDIDRVEVLRGPQGTLYGRIPTGGEINFITNRPTAETQAGLTFEYGSFNSFTGRRDSSAEVSRPGSPGGSSLRPSRAAGGNTID